MPNFVKIPKQLFSITPANAKLYAVFLDFKAFNSEGIISPPFQVKANRDYYRYWLKKLEKRHWVNKTKNVYSLRSYQEVWRLLGIDQSWSRKIKKYKFFYHKIDIEDLPLERTDYTIKLVEMILDKVAGNKARQIKWRLKNKQTPSTVIKTETFLSCRAVAKLFGLKSAASGHKYRKMLFEVIDEPTIRVKTPRGSRFPCKRIAL